MNNMNDELSCNWKRSTKVDCNSSVDEYIDRMDWRVKMNANGSFSAAGLVNNLAGKMIANYWLDKVYNKKEGDAHRNGDYHIHDLDILGAYCCGHDLMRLLNEGFNGVVDRVGSKAPKHFREALYQMANYIGILQSEWAGAQAFSSFDTYLAPYVFFDMVFSGLTVDDVKKAIRNFVFNLNVPSRWGQSPFSNVTIDVVVPNDLKDIPPNRNDQPIFLDIYEEYKDRIETDKELATRWDRFMNALNKRMGKYEQLSHDCSDEDLLYMPTYKHFKEEMEIIDIAFYEVLNEGDINGMPFTFPIPTINVTEDFAWDSKVANVIFENAAKYGSSYFQNFIGSQYKRNPETGELERDPNAYKPNDVRSMCPLTLDTQVVAKRGDDECVLTMAELNPDTDMVMGSDNKWYHFTKTEVYKGKKIVKITVEGDSMDAWIEREVKMSIDHLQPVRISGYQIPDVYATKTADELKVGDILPCGAYKGQICTITKKEYVETEPTQCISMIGSEENLFLLANDILTHNCRLQLDKTQLRKRGGGLFGADAQTGSVGVVTINMARLGYLYKGDEKTLVKKLDGLMELAKSTLEKKRKFVVEMNKRGLYPYTRRYLKTFDTFFSTIGVNGMNEMVRNFTNDEYDITDPRGKEMCIRILDHIREKLMQFQDETGNLYNLEATPAEGTTYRLAKEDKKRFADIIQAGVPEAPYYTNSSQIPASFTADAFEALDLQDDLQCKYTGGTVLHLYMSEPLSSAESCKKLVKSVLSNYRLPYVSVTPTYSICPIHGYIPGNHKYCPLCDKNIMSEHAEELDANS